MAIVKVADRGSLQNLTGQTATDVTITGNTTAGNFLIVRLAMDNSAGGGAAPNVSVSGAAGNTWNVIGPSNRDPGSANTGITCYIMYARMDTPLLLNQTVTFDWQGSPPAKAIVIEEWSGIDPDTPIATSFVEANGATTAVAVTINAPAAGDMVYCALATEGPAGDTTTYDTDTTNGSWSAALTSLATTSGTAASNARIRGQYKLVTAAGNQTWNLTITARDWAALAVVFKSGVAPVSKTASDTLSISLTETVTENLKVTQVDKSASDTLSISATENVTGKDVVGIILTETFEDATLDLTFVSNDWIRTSTQAQSGTWSWTNANISDSQQSDAVITVPEGATDISFWYMVSSEASWDFFRFLIAGVQQFQSAGSVSWTQVTYPVTAGQQLTFRYFKDSSTSSGLDSAFVDNITFSGVIQPPAETMEGSDTASISVTETASTLEAIEEEISPTAILTQTNITGVIGSIDEDPDSSDGVWLDGTGGIVLRVAFPTPAADLKPGFTQRFRVKIRPGT